MPEQDWTHDAAIVSVFLAYLAGMLVIGAVFYRRTESMADYFLGERRLGKWLAALSAQASDMSGWLLLGLPGLAYATGVSASWVAIGLFAGTYLNWRFVARRLRKYTARSSGIITISDYIEYRFRDTTKVLRLVSALFILVFFLLYTSSGFVAGGKLFSATFQIPYGAALALSALVVISYTFLGGFNAVCWTDFFQGILMLLALLIVPAVALELQGGGGAVATSLRESDTEYFNLFALGGGEHGLGLVLGIVSALAWGLGYFGQPHILVRFMAMKSPEDIRHARRIAMVWVGFSLAGALATGMIGRAYLTDGLMGGDSEHVFIVMVDQLFPALIAGVLLAAILAAIMSTADSQLLVTTSAITEDFYKALFRPKAGQSELVWVSRFTVIGVAAVAAVLAFSAESSVLDLVGYAWSGFGAAFGPVILLSLFWKRMTGPGALAGMLAGGVTVLVWMRLEGGLFDLFEIVPGFAAALILIAAVSLLTRPKPGIADEFGAVMAADVDEEAL